MLVRIAAAGPDVASVPFDAVVSRTMIVLQNPQLALSADLNGVMSAGHRILPVDLASTLPFTMGEKEQVRTALRQLAPHGPVIIGYSYNQSNVFYKVERGCLFFVPLRLPLEEPRAYHMVLALPKGGRASRLRTVGFVQDLADKLREPLGKGNPWEASSLILKAGLDGMRASLP